MVDQVQLRRGKRAIDGVLARGVEVELQELVGVLPHAQEAARRIRDLDHVPGVLDEERVSRYWKASAGSAAGTVVAVTMSIGVCFLPTSTKAPVTPVMGRTSTRRWRTGTSGSPRS